MKLASRNNLHNFEAIARLDFPAIELGRGNGLAVMLDDNAARQQSLSEQEFVERAGVGQLSLPSISDYDSRAHK